MEIWDILDKQGRRTGKTVIRGKRSLSKGEYHLVVHIWIVDENGRFLLQKRSNNRSMMRGEWAATGGAAMSGEGSRHAAIRELREELGIHVSRNQMVLIKRMVRKYSINDIWAVKVRSDVRLNLQKEEVAQAKWVEVPVLKEMVQSGNYHNYGKDYFEVIYNIPNRMKNRKF